jgi:hypothetical protein
MRQAAVILGMHRSGTSCLTRVLALCGFALPKTLVVASDGLDRDANSRSGFWESQAIRDLNEALLASAGSSWDDFRDLPANWLAAPQQALFEQRALACLRAEIGDAPRFVIKDPRVCRLVPFWLGVVEKLGAAPLPVIPLRHPVEVAASLQTRDGLPPARSHLLWLRHVLAAERDTRGQDRVLLLYEDLLADWREAVRRIFTPARLALPDLAPASPVSVRVEAYLSPQLRHHIAPDATSADRELPGFLQTAWAWMVDAARGGAPDPEVLDQVAGRLADAELAFAPLLGLAAGSRHGTGDGTRAPEPGADDPLRWALERRLGEAERWQGKTERELARAFAGIDRAAASLAQLEAAAKVMDARFVSVVRETSRLDTLSSDLQARLALLAAGQHQLAALVGLQARMRSARAESTHAQTAEPEAAAETPRHAGRGRRPAAAGKRSLLAALLLAVPTAWLRGSAGQRWLRRTETRIIRESGLFDSDYYLRTNADVQASGCDPLEHYLQFGAAEGRRPNPLFDPIFYLASYPRARRLGINPLVHFIGRGAGDRCNPCADFDTGFYVSRHPEVAASGLNPLLHYLQFGAR